MYAIIDTETTGLNPAKHEVIEVAVILVEEETWQVRRTYQSRIKPQFINEAEARALEVNGYHPDDWTFARSAEEVLGEVLDVVGDATPVGHNISFDINMINANLGRFTQENRKLTHRAIDTMTLVQEHLFPLGLKRAGLDNVREFLGWPIAKHHTALADADDTLRLFKLLWRCTRPRKFLIQLARRLGDTRDLGW